MKRHINIPIFVPHLGCPNECSFCNQKTITSVSEQMTLVRFHEIMEKVLPTIDGEKDEIQIAFFGGSFTAIDEKLKEELLIAAKEYITRGVAGSIRISTRPDAISQKEVEKLLKYGVSSVELGAQSSNDEVLLKNNRGHSFADVVKAVEILKSAHLETGLQMMIGLYGDTAQKSIQTARDMAALCCDTVRIYPTLVLKGTLLENLYRSGEFVPLSREEVLFAAKESVRIFREKGIKILRVGLMASENIAEDKEIVAGFYHPSFGELVESEIFYDRLVSILSGAESLGPNLEIFVNPRDQSKVIGNKRENLKRLKENFKILKIFVTSDEKIPLGEIRI